MSTRIYVVTDTETNRHRLIRAGNQAQAIKYAIMKPVHSCVGPSLVPHPYPRFMDPKVQSIVLSPSTTEANIPIKDKRGQASKLGPEQRLKERPQADNGLRLIAN